MQRDTGTPGAQAVISSRATGDDVSVEFSEVCRFIASPLVAAGRQTRRIRLEEPRDDDREGIDGLEVQAQLGGVGVSV